MIPDLGIKQSFLNQFRKPILVNTAVYGKHIAETLNGNDCKENCGGSIL